MLNTEYIGNEERAKWRDWLLGLDPLLTVEEAKRWATMSRQLRRDACAAKRKRGEISEMDERTDPFVNKVNWEDAFYDVVILSGYPEWTGGRVSLIRM